MIGTNNKSGFSLAETLIALGILAVGMMFIAGAFPVAIQLMTQSTERSIAAVVAEEAFAKVKLYGGRGVNYLNLGRTLEDFNDFSIFPAVQQIGEYEFTYPSVGANPDPNWQYCWSALVRETAEDDSPIQVTVFVCRKAGRHLAFHRNGGGVSDLPVPVRINASATAVTDQLQLPANEIEFVNDDYVIIDDQNGEIYRVTKRLPHPSDNIIQLERRWENSDSSIFWVVPPAIGGGRNPCIGVFQKTIKF